MKNKKYLVTYDERISLSRLRKLKNKLKKYTPDEILEKFYVTRYGNNFYIFRGVNKW